MNANSCLLCLAFAAPAASAATVLEYAVEGHCETDFERMMFDGLHARVDNGKATGNVSTIFDDGEQLMYLLLHDTRQTMVLESDDDAVDFQSDVGRSTLLYSDNQAKKLGMDQDTMMALAQAAMAAACPELADMGFTDPDYAAAAQRCTETKGSAGVLPMDPKAQREMLKARPDGTPSAARPTPPAEPVRWSTTQTERGQRKTIAGIECTLQTVRRGDTVLRQECQARIETLQLDAAATRRITRMVKVGEGLSAGMASLAPERMPQAGKPAALALERTCYADGRATGTATLRIDRDAAVDASQFAVPAGYEPMSMQRPGDTR